MKWWYENEEDMPRKITLVDYDKEGNPFHRDVVIPETAEEARRLEEGMEFDKSRVYTALNADELRAGDKVIVAEDLATLKLCVKDNSPINTLYMIGEEHNVFRFSIKDNTATFALAYLVERAENCTNCGNNKDCKRWFMQDKTERCKDYEPKKASEICINCGHYALGICHKDNHHTNYHDTCEDFRESTGEKKYRPFRDCDELCKVWHEKHTSVSPRPKGTMPLIWVRSADETHLITGEGNEGVYLGDCWISLQTLFTAWTFLDGSVCGVEE